MIELKLTLNSSNLSEKICGCSLQPEKCGEILLIVDEMQAVSEAE